jgi:hypothetical protein
LMKSPKFRRSTLLNRPADVARTASPH